MIKIKFSLLQILTMNSMNIKHQGKSSDSESDSYDENDTKEEVNDLVRLLKAMQEKLKTASYSEQIQILTLVPDKWSRMYCSEYFNVFEYLV